MEPPAESLGDWIATYPQRAAVVDDLFTALVEGHISIEEHHALYDALVLKEE